jgi:hypothetical protein
MKSSIQTLCIILLFGCSSSKNNFQQSSTHDKTKAVSERKMLNSQAFLLDRYATDDSYGYSQNNPIEVGGALQQEGPLNERRFLNGLMGPENQPISYYRQGSCCVFKTPNGFSGTGLLDVYIVLWNDQRDSVSLYINMYDEGELFVPVGLKSKAH